MLIIFFKNFHLGIPMLLPTNIEYFNYDKLIKEDIFKVSKKQIGEKIFPGSLGENILVEGLGDLSHIASGDILKIGKSVTLRVTDQNEPCVTLNSIDNRILKLIVGRKGLVASVESTGYIYPNDKVKLIPKKENV